MTDREKLIVFRLLEAIHAHQDANAPFAALSLDELERKDDAVYEARGRATDQLRAAMAAARGLI